MKSGTFKPRKRRLHRGPNGLKPQKPIKRRNAKRWKKNDDRATGGKTRRDFVASLPCIVCNAVPSEGAHIKTGGMSIKADAKFIAPICFMHHRGGTDSLHNMGPGPFERLHGVDLAMSAAETETLFRRIGGA